MIEPPETVHHAERHKSHIPWFDICMGISVLVVSLGSLYVALHTGHTMEKLVQQNERLVRAQSTPILQYSHTNAANPDAPDDLELGFLVKNVGAGPARIVWFKVHDGGRIFENLSDLLLAKARMRRFDGMLHISHSPIRSTVLSPGDERTLLSWPEQPAGLERTMWRELEQKRFTMPVEACYCSVFDECWTSNLQGDVPQEVTSCEAPTPVDRREGH